MQANPSYTPDQIKDTLRSTANSLGSANLQAQGQGLIDVNNAHFATPSPVPRAFRASTGSGTLEGSRGDVHLVLNGVTLSGEKDIYGMSFLAASMAIAEAAGKSWTGGVWNDSTWAGSAWAGSSWASTAWTGSAWADDSWT
jgi:serine protease AprX